MTSSETTRVDQEIGEQLTGMRQELAAIATAVRDLSTTLAEALPAAVSGLQHEVMDLSTGVCAEISEVSCDLTEICDVVATIAERTSRTWRDRLPWRRKTVTYAA